MAEQRLKLILYGDASSAQKELRKFEREMKTLGRNMGNIGRSLTYGLTLPLLAVGAATTKLAMDAEESESLFTVSMGDMGKAARQWSEEISDALGLNSYEVRRNVATFNTMFKSMGLASDGALEMSKGITELAYDMASFYNLNNQEAFDKLRSGITGEVEPLKALGIIVNEETVKQYAYRNSIAETGEALTEQQKIQARYGAILEQTRDAQGDLSRTQDSATNQMRRLQNRTTELGIKFGEVLLPVFVDLVEVGDKVVGWLDEMDEGQRKNVVIMAGLAAATGPTLSRLSELILAFQAIISWSAKKRIAVLKDAAAETAAHKGTAAAAAAGGAGKYIAVAKGVGLLGIAVAGLVAATNTVRPGGALDEWIDEDRTRRATEHMKDWTQAQRDALKASADHSNQIKNQNLVSASLHQNLESVVKGTDNLTGALTRHKPIADEANRLTDVRIEGVAELTEATGSLIRALDGQMVAENSLAGTQRTLAEADIAARESKLNLADAQESYNDAVKKHGKASDEAKRAKLQLERAEIAATDAAAEYGEALEANRVHEERATARAKAFADRLETIRKRAREAGAALDAMYGSGAGDASRAQAEYGGLQRRAFGAIERATPGGLVRVVAEGGSDEAIIPLNRRRRSYALLAETMDRMGVTAPSGGGVYIERIEGSRVDAQTIAIELERALSARFA